jgi:hypothetical protein
VHYRYKESEISGEHNRLERITIAALPNGRLESVYAPNATNTIWLAGRNAPTLGESFRVRLSFDRLKRKKAWRVQRLHADQPYTAWSE